MINFLKARYDLLYFTLMTIFLLLSCFFSWAVWLLFGFSCLFGCFLSITSIVSSVLYTCGFNVIFQYHSRNIWFYMVTCFVVLLGLRYLLVLYKNAKKKDQKRWFKYFFYLINWKLLLPMLVLLVYLVLPIHNTTIKLTLVMGVWLALLYLVFENRKNIDVCKLVKMFALGLVISGFMSLLRPLSMKLDNIMPYIVTLKYVRFSGLTTHPNQYAMFALLAISALLLLNYVDKIDYIGFWSLFIPLFAFGFCTISRNFIIAFVVDFILFYILYFFKYKKAVLKSFGIMLLVLSVIFCIFFTETKITLVRFDFLSETTIVSHDTAFLSVDESAYEKFSDEWWNLVYDGKIVYDPGRVGLWKEYFSDWSSCIKNALFGKGIAQPWIGGYSAHNLLLKYLWRDGVLGILFWLCVLFGMVNVKEFKKIKPLNVLLVIVPYLCLGLFEYEPCLIFAYTILLVLFDKFCFEKNEREKSVFVTTGILPVPATKGGAVETLTEYLLQNNEKKCHDKYEVVSIYEKKAEEVAENYHNTNFEFIHVPKFIDLIDRIIYLFAKKVLHKENMMTYRHAFARFIYLYQVSVILQKNDYEKVIIENSSPLFLALKWNGNSIKYQNRVSYHLHNEVKKGYGCTQIIKNCRKIMCVSEFVKNSIADFLQIDGNSKNLCVVKNCVDKNAFNGCISAEEKAILLKKYNIDSKDKIILFTGRLTKEKGIDVLLNALTSIKTKNVKLIIVGGYFFDTNIKSNYITKLEELKAKLTNKVVFTGFVNYKDLPKYYAIADLVVLPSMWEEPAGMTMMECLSSGKGLITTISGGIPEYVGDAAILLPRDENLVINLANAIDNYFEKQTKIKINRNRIIGIEEYCDDFASCIRQ